MISTLTSIFLLVQGIGFGSLAFYILIDDFRMRRRRKKRGDK